LRSLPTENRAAEAVGIAFGNLRAAARAVFRAIEIRLGQRLGHILAPGPAGRLARTLWRYSNPFLLPPVQGSFTRVALPGFTGSSLILRRIRTGEEWGHLNPG